MELRLSPDERAALEQMAKVRKRSVSEYVREAAAHHIAYDRILLEEKRGVRR